MSTRKPRPPGDLGERGRGLWRQVTGTWQLRPDEVELLAESCRALDRLDQVRAELAAAPMTVTGSKGQVQRHPLLSEERAQRALYARLVSQLGLPDMDAPAGASTTPRSRAARKAAESRWGRVRQLQERRAARLTEEDGA